MRTDSNFLNLVRANGAALLERTLQRTTSEPHRVFIQENLCKENKVGVKESPDWTTSTGRARYWQRQERRNTSVQATLKANTAEEK